jgi:hypothetical protein
VPVRSVACDRGVHACDVCDCCGQEVEGEVVRLYARVCCSGVYAVAEELLKKQKKDRIVFDRCAYPKALRPDHTNMSSFHSYGLCGPQTL